MAHLTLVEAFAKFGGKPTSRLHSFSAMAADGAMILSCAAGRYAHPTPGVLRYEHRLSSESEHPAEAQALGEHLSLARDGNLPIRMIVVNRSPADEDGKSTRTVHVRPDLVGKVIKFDGDHFIVDFVRAGEIPRAGQRAAARGPI
jgi:hypothetical protein